MNWSEMLFSGNVKYKRKGEYYLLNAHCISGLSLALNKDVCDWLRQTLSLEKASDPS